MNGTKFKILIVDDERSNIVALAHILKPEYDILVAKDGRTAFEVAGENKPDLILLDIIMPDMTGFDVLSKLKSVDLTRRIPVIFITGRNSAEDEEMGFFLGAADYITKPFHNSIVKARVKTHLQTVEYISTIERLCMIDALTNIPNRRNFASRIITEWDKAICNKTPISILMIDVDWFKQYNDTYGHSQGDALLRALAGVLKQTLKRPEDFVARWGGEEFAVLLPDTGLNAALELAEQIRANVERMVIPCADGTNTTITVSIGVHSEIPADGDQGSDFISGADKALYTAKTSGRNRVCS